MTDHHATPPDALRTLPTPLALLDARRMQRNIDAMQARIDGLGVKLRPHVKTGKAIEIVRRLRAAGASGVTVSTLREAQACFADGVTDILYAVGIAAVKLDRVRALREQGCALKILCDNEATARAIVEHGRAHRHRFEVWLEIDTDGHRAGLDPQGDALLAVARVLHEGGATVGGVMTHAGASYELHDDEALRAIAETERAGCVRAAERLRETGIACPNVSVGSTPTALSAGTLAGVTEVRAGVYVFQDLVMANVGVATFDDIALSVLTTVIGHQREKGWALIDAGWMALSRDRGTQGQAHDYGYGQVCALDGRPMHGYTVVAANQEHGIIARADAADADIERHLPVGTTLRILPNHACATAAQFDEYVVLDGDTLTRWPRFNGW